MDLQKPGFPVFKGHPFIMRPEAGLCCVVMGIELLPERTDIEFHLNLLSGIQQNASVQHKN